MVDFKLTKTDKTSDLVETNLSYHRKEMSDMDKDNNDDDDDGANQNQNNFKRHLFHFIQHSIIKIKVTCKFISDPWTFWIFVQISSASWI